MAASQNGWSANDRSKVSSRLIPGTTVRLTVRNGAPGDLLLEVASLFDRLVQDVDNARGVLDDWGYAERPIRGSTTTLSNHASGTAIDLNATRWALGRPASVNLNPAQIATVWRIVAATGGVVVWGARWSRPDPMHFELARGSTEAICARALTELRAAFNATVKPPLVERPTPVPVPAPLPPREDDPMADIALLVDEHGKFRRMVKVEAGGYGSEVADHAAVTLGVDLGGARFTLTARDATGQPFRPDPTWDSVNLDEAEHWGAVIPAGTRSLVIEGEVAPGAQPCCAVFHWKD